MISKEEIKKLGLLARVEVDGKEVDSLKDDLGKILGFVSKLKLLFCNDQSTEIASPDGGVMREDENPHKAGKYTEDLTGQAPDMERGYVKVKKVL